MTFLAWLDYTLQLSVTYIWPTYEIGTMEDVGAELSLDTCDQPWDENYSHMTGHLIIIQL